MQAIWCENHDQWSECDVVRDTPDGWKRGGDANGSWRTYDDQPVYERNRLCRPCSKDRFPGIISTVELTKDYFDELRAERQVIREALTILREFKGHHRRSLKSLRTLIRVLEPKEPESLSDRFKLVESNAASPDPR